METIIAFDNGVFIDKWTWFQGWFFRNETTYTTTETENESATQFIHYVSQVTTFIGEVISKLLRRSNTMSEEQSEKICTVA
ncbi:hypothetical protein CAEBREN_31733 [Caenorhabditis brenneri]|uniref:Uncharacterized protein n=1 Tax=Caenorhabditis brenneri TaxID=135651 RepID=G0NB94_CAEBE|nr:hypothetical protein CAEBREN_31733 [Caenorhabditis brenneri]